MNAVTEDIDLIRSMPETYAARDAGPTDRVLDLQTLETSGTEDEPFGNSYMSSNSYCCNC